MNEVYKIVHFARPQINAIFNFTQTPYEPIGLIPAHVTETKNITTKSSLDKQTAKALIQEGDELFRERHPSIILPKGNTDKSAHKTAETVEKLGWVVLRDENNNPVQAIPKTEYNKIKEYLKENNGEIELKITWAFYHSIAATNQNIKTKTP